LVTIASVTANQDPRDEARDRIEQAEDAAVVIDGETLQGAGRLGALVALKRHGIFDRARAEGFIDARLRHDTPPPGPALLVDAQTGERWMRVGDVAAFLRYATGAPPMSQATLDGRLSAIGVERRRYAARRRSNGVHVAVKLYRLPPAGLADDDPDVVDVDVSEGA
jgi:hypothetical protein